MKSMLDKLPALPTRLRWAAIDEALFFLVIEGILTQTEKDRALKRLAKILQKEGLELK